MARYWVGGATGFLGSHLVRELRRMGHELVAVASRQADVEGVAVAAVDALDAEAVASSAAGCDGAFVAIGRVSRDPKDAEALHRLHVVGTERVLGGLRAAGVPRVVYTSTSGTVAVGEESRGFTEADPTPTGLIGQWPYYRTKLYGEQIARAASSDGFRVITINPSLLLGPGDARGSSTDDVRRFLEGEVPACPSGGLAFVDARDVATAMVAAFERGRAGERYLLSAANLSFREFFRRLEQLSGVAAPKLSLPPGRRAAGALHGAAARALSLVGKRPPLDRQSLEMAQCFWYCDCSKAERELSFAPRDPGETLRDTIADLVDRGVAFPRVTARQAAPSP